MARKTRSIKGGGVATTLPPVTFQNIGVPFTVALLPGADNRTCVLAASVPYGECERRGPRQMAVLSRFKSLTLGILLPAKNDGAILRRELRSCSTSTPPSSEIVLWPICLGLNMTFSLAMRTSTKVRMNGCRVSTRGLKLS